MKTGAELIAEERQRQIDVEGWTKEHDAQYKDGELAKVAICYADPVPHYRVINRLTQVRVPNFNFWPKTWGLGWFKPTNRIRNLVKAGALIAAEIDRLQSEKQGEQKPANNVEPRFKVGDIVINKKSKDTVKIEQVLHDSYCYSGWDGAATVHSDFSISEQDNWEFVEQKPNDEYKEWYDFIRWFVKQRTNDYTLIPSDDDIHKWGDNILNHARKVLEQNTKL